MKRLAGKETSCSATLPQCFQERLSVSQNGFDVIDAVVGAEAMSHYKSFVITSRPSERCNANEPPEIVLVPGVTLGNGHRGSVFFLEFFFYFRMDYWAARIIKWHLEAST